MKKFILLLSVLCLSVTALSARGIPIPVQFGVSDELETVQELPDTDDYRADDGLYVDLARHHKEFSIMWIPIWVTQEPQLVLMKKGVEDQYWEVDEATMNTILEENNLNKDDFLSLGFWTRYGGKLVIICIVALLIWGMIPSDDDEEEEQEVEAKEL